MFLYADLLKARLVSDITDIQTSITIDDASLLPTLEVGQYFKVELRQNNKREIAECTAVAGNVLTITRAIHYPYSFKSGALCTISIDPYGYELTTSSTGVTQAQVLARQSIGF